MLLFVVDEHLVIQGKQVFAEAVAAEIVRATDRWHQVSIPLHAEGFAPLAAQGRTILPGEVDLAVDPFHLRFTGEQNILEITLYLIP